jgi:hypothetical protein
MLRECVEVKWGLGDTGMQSFSSYSLSFTKLTIVPILNSTTARCSPFTTARHLGHCILTMNQPRIQLGIFGPPDIAYHIVSPCHIFDFVSSSPPRLCYGACMRVRFSSWSCEYSLVRPRGRDDSYLPVLVYAAMNLPMLRPREKRTRTVAL